VRYPVQTGRDHTLPHDQHQRNEACDLHHCNEQQAEHRSTICHSPIHQIGDHRQHDQCKHHRQILDDQPAHRDLAALSVDRVACL